MNDHVAVLRRVRDFLARPYINDPKAVAALDHAIAATERYDRLKENHDAFNDLYLREVASRIDAENARDALVARLGELEKAWRDNYEILPSQWFATQLDRVVAGNGGGE